MIQSLQSSRHQRYQQQPLLGACRKRTFEDAIELTRPLGNDPSTEHAGWLGSIKRRKIHHFPTRWTSTLSPSPYIKLLAMRDFWDVMMSRMDLSWLDLWTASGSNTTEALRRFGGDSEMQESDGDDEQEVESGRSSVGSDAETERSDEMDTEQGGAYRPSDSEIRRTAITKEQQYSAVSGPISKAVSNLRKSNTDHDDAGESTWSMCAMLHRKKRTVVQHPSAALFLRGLWEEEEHCRRQKQMIPDGVHKPIRSKVLNRKPLLRTAATASKSPSNKSQALNTGSGSTSSSKDASSSASVPSSPSSSPDKDSDIRSTSTSPPAESSADKGDSNDKDQEEPEPQGSARNGGDQGMVLRKKYGPSAALRSNALSEGYDLNEYKPWKDATIMPHQGCIQTLRKMRCTMLEPWPVEESLAKDECSRILHVMREQLNVVINLQIHLRSMIKTAPQQMSFLLSIRHPGQISIELLNALYGPQFMQTNAFRSIEQLLWGKNHCWKALDSSSISSLQHHRPPAQLVRYSSSSSCSQGSRGSSYSQPQQDHLYQQRQQYPEYSYRHHDHREADDEHDSMFDGVEDVQHDHRHHEDYQEHHYQDYHDGHDEEYDEHDHQYPRHHDHNNQTEYHEGAQHAYYDQRHHHHHKQYSSSRHYHHQDGTTHSPSTSSSLRYSRTVMEDVSECEFEDEFDESPYQDTLLEIDPIDITSSYSDTENMVVEKQRKAKSTGTTMASKDGGYESGSDVSEGEIEALEISSSSSSSLEARTFQR
ncbi:hypothetical protein BGZ95_010629 [Linnemannia exigua]|uniref:Uncharacterized protein n=1 Tax=Linnemannia exigua TaxID=604196 RepID=A0AAD4H706_9FUNG|nr:hypothetical protein BGZ95_010629 [Linnemannia exigua]